MAPLQLHVWGIAPSISILTSAIQQIHNIFIWQCVVLVSITASTCKRESKIHGRRTYKLPTKKNGKTLTRNVYSTFKNICTRQQKAEQTGHKCILSLTFFTDWQRTSSNCIEYLSCISCICTSLLLYAAPVSDVCGWLEPPRQSNIPPPRWSQPWAMLGCSCHMLETRYPKPYAYPSFIWHYTKTWTIKTTKLLRS